MLDYPCSTRMQLRRLPPVLLVSIAIFLAAITEAQGQSGPEIITYGETCPTGQSRNLPYQIQTPLTISKSSEAAYIGSTGGNFHGYGNNQPSMELRSSNAGFQLPISVQEPFVPYRYSEAQQRSDSLRGRTYGVKIQPSEPTAPQRTPSLGLYDLNVQQSVPAARRYEMPSDPSSHSQVPIQPVPVEKPRNYDGSPSVPTRRLTGLTSRIDKILIPACDLPNQNGNCGSNPSTCGCAS